MAAGQAASFELTGGSRLSLWMAAGRTASESVVKDCGVGQLTAAWQAASFELTAGALLASMVAGQAASEWTEVAVDC